MEKLMAIITCCAIILFVSFFSAFKEGFEETSKDLVISRYNESLAWLADIDRSVYRRVVVYNKGDPMLELDNLGDIIIVTLSNVGRCDHTYMYHIVQTYDDLANVTIFLPGSCDINYNWATTKNTITSVNMTNSSVFYCTKLNIPEDIKDFSFY